ADGEESGCTKTVEHEVEQHRRDRDKRRDEQMVREWIRPEETEENREPAIRGGTQPSLRILLCEGIEEARNRAVVRGAHDAEPEVVVVIEAETRDIECRRYRGNCSHDEDRRQPRTRSVFDWTTLPSSECFRRLY